MSSSSADSARAPAAGCRSGLRLARCWLCPGASSGDEEPTATSTASSQFTARDRLDMVSPRKPAVVPAVASAVSTASSARDASYSANALERSDARSTRAFSSARSSAAGDKGPAGESARAGGDAAAPGETEPRERRKSAASGVVARTIVGLDGEAASFVGDWP